MIHRDDITGRSADVLGEQSPPAVQRLITTLDAACSPKPSPRAAQLDAAMTRLLYERSAMRHQTERARRDQPVAWPGRRVVALVAAAMLTMSGVAGYLRLGGFTPVDAQTVLRRAAALRLAPNQVTHVTYSVTTAGGYTGTADVWVQADASGAPTQSAQTLTMLKDGAAVPALSNRLIQAGQHIYSYYPRDNTILMDLNVDPVTILNGVPAVVFDGVAVGHYLSAPTQGQHQDVRLLPQQSLDGRAVDVVEWDSDRNQRVTFYFDAQSYLLRGFDTVDRSGQSWQARLSTDATVAAAAVPPQTFTLNAPATAHVVPPHPAPDSALNILMDGTAANAFAAACHSTNNVKEVLWSSWGKSPLAACRATNRAMTADGLVAALSSALTGPDKAALDRAVAAGMITPAQESASLATLQSQLMTWVSRPATSGPQPPPPPGGWPAAQSHP